ncbi:hypothetical protein SAMN05444156_2333 [Verrucomicrobium sp. GAS474]|nr:hypothetical protein SAMN05444156_2333 [Verrucomicrobium sp. GAS474]
MPEAYSEPQTRFKFNIVLRQNLFHNLYALQTRKQKKDFVLRARVTRQMKDAWNHLVIESGESEAFHLREAVREYLEKVTKK